VQARDLEAQVAVLSCQLGDPDVGEFESATHGLGRGWGDGGTHAWSGPSVTGRVDRVQQVGLGVDPGSSDLGSAGEERDVRGPIAGLQHSEGFVGAGTGVAGSALGCGA